MAGRIRTIKPELLNHVAFTTLTDGAARLFIGLYMLADDDGRAPADPQMLRGLIFSGRPRPPNVVGQLLSECETAGLLRRYSVRAAAFLEIHGWHGEQDQEGIRRPVGPTYQAIPQAKRQPSRFPAPPWFSASVTDSAQEALSSKSEHEHEREPESERDRAARAAASSAGATPSPAGWQPPAGGRFWEEAERRTGAGELGAQDVQACIAALIAAGVHKKPNADAIGAKWIARQRPEGEPAPRKARGSRKSGAEFVGYQPPADDSVYDEAPWAKR